MQNTRDDKPVSSEFRDLDRERTGGSPEKAYDDRVDRRLKDNADEIREEISGENDDTDRRPDGRPANC